MNLLSLSKKYVSEQEIQLEKDLIFLKKNKNTFCKKYKLDFVVSENKVLLPFDLKASEN
jgi:hypothetical protein